VNGQGYSHESQILEIERTVPDFPRFSDFPDFPIFDVFGLKCRGCPQCSVGVERMLPMRLCKLVAMMLLPSLVLSGCARPERVKTFSSPRAEIFLTVETYGGGPGPLGSDVTKVYAHFERYGKSRRVLVMEGDSLTISNIIWNTPHDDTICLDGGITDTFHNQVTLILGNGQEDSETIHNHLDEHCP
jgi:hypothetical protein